MPRPSWSHGEHGLRIEGVHLGAGERQVVAGLAQRERLIAHLHPRVLGRRHPSASRSPNASRWRPCARCRPRCGRRRRGPSCRCRASRRPAWRPRGCRGTPRSRARRSGCACSARTWWRRRCGRCRRRWRWPRRPAAPRRGCRDSRCRPARIDRSAAPWRHGGRSSHTSRAADVHRIRRRAAFGRLLLDEVGDRRRLLPRFVIQPAIDTNGSVGHPCGRGSLAIRGAVNWRLR